jgi:hypothetical protein
MGFWGKAFEVTKNVGTTIANEIEKNANEIREIKQKYEEASDRELLEIVRSEGFFGKSQKEKAVAFTTLKSRGYDADTIKSVKT